MKGSVAAPLLVPNPHCALTRREAPLGPLVLRAGEGNRNLIADLEGRCSTIELHPQTWSGYRVHGGGYFAAVRRAPDEPGAGSSHAEPPVRPPSSGHSPAKTPHEHSQPGTIQSWSIQTLSRATFLPPSAAQSSALIASPPITSPPFWQRPPLLLC